jgi:hypothetical protein
MNKQARYILGFLGIVTLMSAAAIPAQAQYQNYYRRVLLVHVSGGTVLPVVENDDDQHDLGFDIGLGLGFMLPTSGSISPEIDFRFNFYRLPRSTPTDRYILNEANNEYSFALEGRFRYLTKKRFRPFGLGGVGLYDTSREGAKSKLMVTFGGGLDWSFDPKESVLFYSELRYVAGPRGMLRLDLGVRIG